jgi:hypothetical protein
VVRGFLVADLPDEPQSSIAAISPIESSASQWAWPEADISILVLESYGHTLFTRDDHRQRIAPTYERLSRVLQREDIHVASSFLVSPAFGGRSWLADATILAGRWLGDQRAYEAILETDQSNIVRYLGSRGYRSVLAAPAMTYFEEGWREFYTFDDAYIAGQFGYRGPYFDFGVFTDQYLLHFLAEEAIRNDDGRPRFSMAILITPHVPFRVLPPYIEDWSSIGDGSIYHDLERRIFDNNWLGGGEYPEGYTATIDYTLTSVVDHIILNGAPHELFIVVGDHQPRIPISEREATYSVPIHIVSKDRSLVMPFLVYGYREGLLPTQREPHKRMDTIYPMVREIIEGTWQVRREIVGTDYSRLSTTNR